MITIRHQTIVLPSNSRDILTMIRPTTTNFRWLFGNSFFRYYSEIDKPWYGVLKVKEKEFEIRRNGLGLFIDQLSSIVVKGTVVEDQDVIKLDIKYKLSTLRTMILVGIIVVLLLSPVLLDNDLAKILSGAIFLIAFSTLTIRDYIRTKRQFNQLIEKLVSNEPQHRI